MKQIFWNHQGVKGLIFIALALIFGCAAGPGAPTEGRIYKIIGQKIKGASPDILEWTLEKIETMGTEQITSAYFDKALGYEGSKFQVFSFAELVKRFDPDGLSDAVLLNCYDDYQGILSIKDIKRYDIQLATRIHIQPEYKKPDWLHPLLIIVPNESGAPFQERYLTANIRELKFTHLGTYYAPLEKVVKPQTRQGYSSFKNNCLFCHSLMGIGGNKGVRLLKRYDYSRSESKERFMRDFSGFHHKDNFDKQNFEQFVSKNQLQEIYQFLQLVKNSQPALPPPGK